MRLPSARTIRVPRLRLPWSSTRRENLLPLADAPLGKAADSLEGEDIRILRRTRLRLMVVSALVTALLLVALGVATYMSASQLLANNSLDSMQEAASSTVQNLQRDPRPVRHPLVFGEDPNTGVFVLPANGPTVMVQGPEGAIAGLPDQASATAARSGQTDVRTTTVTIGKQSIPLRVLSIQGLPDGTVVQVIQDRRSEVAFLSTLLTVLVGVGLLAMFLAVVAGYLYAGRALVPIRASMTRREAALKRQREFAANASHELRTPLTVIGASVEDLKRNRRSRVEDVGEALGDIDAEVRHMTALVEDLLLLARTDSGVVQLEKVPVDLAEVAVEAVSTLAAVAQEKEIHLELDPFPAVVMGDQLRLRQLVTILTDNAIKHGAPKSSVLVHVRPNGAGLATLWVDDSGPGVRPEDVPRIFERFWRADNAPLGGTGLGLSIAKWIVEQHQGTLGAYNRPEGGATFWAQIPQWSAPTDTAEDADAGDPATAEEAVWAPEPDDQPDDRTGDAPRGEQP